MIARSALPSLALLALPALAGCGSGAEQAAAPEPSEAVTEASGPRTLVPTNLALDELGPHIVGPEGPSVESAFSTDGREIGTMISFVTCPAEKDAEICDPAVQPEDTVYTYVHHVTLAEAAEGAEPVAVAQFRTVRPAAGFANVIGFDEDEVARTLGEGGDVKVQIDNGSLVWRIATGDGWTSGESLTFYWRSTSPPEGPSEAFAIEAGGLPVLGTGPFPAAESPVDETATN